ncbi:MAG: vWA domain-containing protein [Thermoanaerobaculia bacterium]
MILGRFSISLSLALLINGPARAQCSKQIVVYLDISGSMEPTSRSPASPFFQTLDALEQLLDTPGFLGADDELDVVLFGAEPKGIQPARGPFSARKLLVSLKANQQSDRFTDLARVLEDARNKLQDGSRFDRQVVVLASDFVHEPTRVPPGSSPELFVADWDSQAGTRMESLRPLLEDRSKRVLVLVRAPLAPTNERLRAVREATLKALTRDLVAEKRVFDTSAGVGASQALAEQIRTSLLQPLELSAKWVENGSELEVEVRNRNCQAQTVDRLALTCRSSDGRSIGVPIAIPDVRGRSVGAAGSASSTLSLRVPGGRMSCQGASESFDIEVFSREGAEGITAGSLANRLEFGAADALREPYFLGETLRVTVEMRGQTLTPSRHYLVIKDEASQRVLARASFEAPTNLDPIDWQHYRFTFPRRLVLPGSEATGLKVEIQDAETQGVQARVVRDRIASRVESGQFWLVTVITGVLLLLRVRRTEGQERTVALFERLVEWLSHPVVPFLAVLILQRLLPGPPLTSLSPERLGKQVLLAGIVAYCVGAFSRSYQRSVLRKARPAERFPPGAELPPNLPEEVAIVDRHWGRGHYGWIAGAIAGLMLFGVLVAIALGSDPTLVPELAKAEELRLLPAAD